MNQGNIWDMLQTLIIIFDPGRNLQKMALIYWKIITQGKHHKKSVEGHFYILE